MKNLKIYLFPILILVLFFFNTIIAQTLGGAEICEGSSCRYYTYQNGKKVEVYSACCPHSPLCSELGCTCGQS